MSESVEWMVNIAWIIEWCSLVQCIIAHIIKSIIKINNKPIVFVLVYQYVFGYSRINSHFPSLFIHPNPFLSLSISFCLLARTMHASIRRIEPHCIFNGWWLLKWGTIHFNLCTWKLLLFKFSALSVSVSLSRCYLFFLFFSMVFHSLECYFVISCLHYFDLEYSDYYGVCAIHSDWMWEFCVIH